MKNTQALVNTKMSIGMDQEFKSEMEAEAYELGLKTSVYARMILQNRKNSLLENGEANLQAKEQISKLQIDNKRLRLLLDENSISEGTSEEQAEEINALQAENEALRADLELSRTESENSADPDAITAMEQDLINVNLLVEEAELRLLGLQKTHEFEKESLIAEHEKVKKELIDELNQCTWSEIPDEEAELIAQHEKEFAGIVEKLKKEQEESAQKNIHIEELRARISAYADDEANQAESSNVHNAKFEALSVQVSELENELTETKSQLSAEMQMVADLSGELESKKADYATLHDEMKESEQQLNQLRTQSEEFYNKHEEQRKENQQIASEAYSQTQTIERLEASLREAEIKYKQLRHEKSVAEREKISVTSNLERLQEAVNADKHNLLLLQENALKQTEEANMLYQNQTQETAAYQNKCVKKQAHIEGLERLTQKLQEEIDLLNDQLEMIGEEVTEEKIGYVEPVFESKYPQPTATKFNENENELYSEYITCLSEKHPEAEVEKLILASLDNACQNENAVWVSVPFSKSLKSINKKI